MVPPPVQQFRSSYIKKMDKIIHIRVQRQLLINAQAQLQAPPPQQPPQQGP